MILGRMNSTMLTAKKQIDKTLFQLEQPRYSDILCIIEHKENFPYLLSPNHYCFFFLFLTHSNSSVLGEIKFLPKAVR